MKTTNKTIAKTFERPVEKVLAGAAGAYMLSETFKGVYGYVNAAGNIRYAIAGVFTLLVAYFAVLFIRNFK